MMKENPFAPVSPQRQLYRSIRDTWKLLQLSRAVSQRQQRSWVQIVKASFHFYFVRRFTPGELSTNGALHGTTSDHMISKRDLVELQYRLNPESWAYAIADKAFFHRLAQASQLDALPVIAYLFQGYQGGMKKGAIPNSEQEWIDRLIESLPGEFIIKPTTGAGGTGMRVYRRDGREGLVCLNNSECLSIADLVRRCARDPFYSGYIIQNRILNGDELRRLTGSDALQTVRVVTLLKSDGEVEIFLPRFRMARSGNLTDNFCGGATGNAVAALDLDSGVINRVLLQSETGRTEPISHHPDTGAPLLGFEYPHWQETLELARQAARTVFPLRCVGWDIADTPDGPTLVEGNSIWDPPNEDERLAPVVDRLRAEVGMPPRKVSQ